MLANSWRAVSPRCLTLLALVALLFAAPNAKAQGRYFVLDRAQLSGAPEDGFMVWRPYVPEETRFYGTAALGFSLNPLRASTVTDAEEARDIDNPVQGQFFTTYFMLGAQIAKRVTVGVGLPVVWWHAGGDDPIAQGVGRGGIGGDCCVLGDLRFDGRVQAYETDDRKLRLGFGGAIWAPTGNQTKFAGDGQAHGWLFGSGEYDFGSFFISGQLGPHFRPGRSIGGVNGDLFIGSELRWAFGGYLPLRDGTIRLGVELFGSTGITEVQDRNTFFSGNNTPLEWMAQARFVLDKRERLYLQGGAGTRLTDGYGAPDVRVLASIGTYLTIKDFESVSPPPKIRIVPGADDYDVDRDGDGYPDAVDKCPDVKEDGKPPLKTDGCPAVPDADNDGIPDANDKCPNDPEDKDGIDDKDGCPEKDADNDKVPDVEDRCPTEPGPRSKVAEKNGCPTLTKVTSDGQVALLEPIQFEFGRATIKPVSYPILNEVVTLMQARPDLRIGVYGHTDNVGSHQLNMRLSKERAASVMNYLIKKGISATRLESEGFGPDKPVDTNDTAEGRAKNRRVEFKILGQ